MRVDIAPTPAHTHHTKASTMTVTILDPKTALIVIDLQKGIVSLPTVHPIGDVVKHASALADAFRRHGLPVVLVNVDGGAPGRTEQAPRIGSVSRRMDRSRPRTEPAAAGPSGDEADVGRIHQHRPRRRI